MKTFTNKGCQIAAQKKVVFGRILPSSLPPLPGQILPPFLPPRANFALLSRIFFCIGATIHIGQEILCLPYAGFFAMGLC